ncbi:MAG: CopG family ribbon-helix-helix protein [Candidatus Thermoplasmatota archaeon]|nr:CopG family ribbon-helix-helix protein [Euryarchaeota archaeon]MBU4032294.1 CopG family ribbon-helix-helix protein [Candidatus Thermoplasmatota archaeon]MBU4071455.1 CopG family ribbon-helix-helix protein [Candidatus Thermoplasmatota archaeon]MBU4144441.1 CopG family ribbon-helix-helix protein [Candidatus Thermoplasmatota archaeon]MBU4592327.1 CopG family ribbon-helix-helix protein [Candidatus Thermoplasmatota archaeon]
MTKGLNGTKIVSLSLPNNILRDIDSAADEMGYSSRSELVRDAVRAFLRDRSEISKLEGHINGVLILVYHHDSAAQVSEVRHRHMSVFKSFMHADFDGGDDCCEVLMFCGEANDVKESYNQLSTLVGVKEARIFLA